MSGLPRLEHFDQLYSSPLPSSMVLRFPSRLQTNLGGCMRLLEAYQGHWVVPLDAYRCRREEYIYIDFAP